MLYNLQNNIAFSICIIEINKCEIFYCIEIIDMVN